ncbi:PREDICTED: uncharacterized protein LOC105569631 isoform X2 [Vollenhovia emeryi]|uniref:uncharacterized protein LOC105569631 isoform X2 n=1 Tax=Vollenhovia emeryi TaxID=411798 RepID=UPI0005F4CF3C|nr:PREDICTED: uncharacterized protein LOC105569631 isoform X2 [Vollenhovia emeryi]XP_011881641.1 PREDICTED: uncharacterized protein LOC105569631 isoform X2 [Vollenhovia emeryi]
MAAPQASSRLEMLQARFQQKQLQEKEQKLLQLYDQQQQRAYQVVQRGSAGSNSSHHGSTAARTTTTTCTSSHSTSTSQGGKVRQMFDERRQTTVKGIDRSYPLEPLENRLRKQANANGVATQRNGNVTVNRQSVKRVTRADVNSNVNGGKPVVSYHEEIIRDSFGPPVRRHDDDDDYGVESRVATFANGHYRHEIDNEQEESLDQDTIERNRMMAKIHLMGFDETLKHRVRNDLNSEEFPEYLMADAPDKLSKRNVTKKLSQAEERLERFKNANAKRSNAPKQSTPTSTVIKKRSEQATKSNSRARSEIAGTSPISARSGSSWTSELSQRIFENAKSPLPVRFRVADEMSARRSSDTEIFSQRRSPRSFSARGTTKAETTSRFYPRSNEFKSLTSDGKIIVRRSASPQFFCRESERSATTMSIDRKSDSSGSPLFHQETFTKRNKSPRFFLHKSGHSRRMSESKSPVWSIRISSSQSTSPQYFRYEPKRTETPMSTDRETIRSKSPEWSKGILTKRDMTDFERKKIQTSTTLGRQSSQFKSPLYEEKILKRRSTSPQFFCKESERSATTMSIDRATSGSRSPSHDREIVTKRRASPQFFLSESKQSRKTSESKSPIWSDRGISSRQSTSPQYLRYEPKRTETPMSTDRETIGSKSPEWSKGILTKRDVTDFERKKVQTSTLGRQSSRFKSPLYEEKILKRRSTSPQFFCKESERSATTMSIDRATSGSRSPSHDREIVTKRRTSPRFFLSESTQSRKTSESKSPIWSDREISSRQSTSPQYRESKRSETAMSTDRETIESKSSEWNKRSSRPQFFCRESERSGTTMSIDRKVSGPRSSSYDRKLFTKRGATPRLSNGKTEQRSATNINWKYSGLKSPEIMRDKRSTTSPQFFCKESEKSATTMLIEPRPRSVDSTKTVLKHVPDSFYGRSVKSPFDKKISSTKYRHTPSPSVTGHRVKRPTSKNEVSNSITARRSSRISETSATSASSIVDLRYGLEFDNILQSAGLVRKFMKSQNGKQRTIRQSPSKRNITDVNARISARGDQSKNRRKTSPLLQTTSSPSIEGRKRATPEFSRKTITPTEVDMDIQEITMTDHRIEYDKRQKASSPISERQFDGTCTKSPGSGAKFQASITYPVRKTHRQRESILKWSAFKGDLSERGSMGRRSDRESGKSVISLSKFGPVSESSRIITRDREDESSTSFRTRDQSAGNQAKYIATRSTRREDRQRASSRSPNQMRSRFTENRADSPKAKSPDFSRGTKYADTVSPILYDFAKRTKGARTKFDQPQSLRSARLVQGAANSSTDDKYNRGREGEKTKDIADVDEVDARIDTKHQTVVGTALTEKIKDYRAITRPNSADPITNKKVFLRETTQKPMKSSTSKKTISPTRECGRRYDVRSRVSPRISPLRKTAEISRDAYTSKILSSRSIVSKTDQSPTSKLSTSTIKDRKHESVLVAKKLADSFNKMSVKRKIEEPKDSAKELSKVLRENKCGKDFERLDSVESALRRFDSVGAESERTSPTNFRAFSEISLQTIDVPTKASIKDSTASEGTTVPCREITNHTILRSVLKSPVGKDLRAKNAAHKSDLRILQKQTRPSKRPTRAESKQSSTKIRSPTCKRRLFESDSEREIRGSKSSCVKARKDENSPFVNFSFRKDKAVSDVRSANDFGRDVTRESMRPQETVSVKSLRSIDDIRKSIDNERNKLVATKGSRSAIANRRATSREGVDARRSSPATNAAENVFLGADPARLIKIKSCVSRITKSPSPDSAATKQREMNARMTRGSAPSSPSKSPEVAPRRTATESRNQEAKRRSMVAKGADSTGSKMTGAVNTTDGVVFRNGSPNESTSKSDAIVIDFDDRPSSQDDAMPLKKSSMKKSFNDKQQTTSSASGRPTSNSSVNLIQDSSAKGRMAESERGKGAGKGGGKSKVKGTEKSSSSSGKLANESSFNEDATDTKGLVKCKTCGRSFAQNRIDLHEEICMKTAIKKRKQFDPVMSRVKGTELEPFVKKGLGKRETKTKKADTKLDWRRKHEEFISAIRYARETQARLAAGGNLSDLPPPPPSDTSDYVQCEHCGRKFNRSAAERHIPICKRMHDKKQTQAPKARR